MLDVPQLGLTEAVPGRNNFTYLSGKIDQVWNKPFVLPFRQMLVWWELKDRAVDWRAA